MKCKYCGCEEFYKEVKNMHLGVYCKACNEWQIWEKHTDNTKTKEEYLDEWLEKQPASQKQIVYVKAQIGSSINKLQIKKVLKDLGIDR